MSVAAHRGNSKYFPENTMAAFRSAASLNPDMIEIDLHMTKDGEIILMHDHKVDRTTNGTGFVKDFTLDETRQLDAGSWKGEE
ncbi:MAG: glycerophosphodiester phosphodiesterase, partial [Clostridia bacterium]|nr:glycerophosphodiester phosphodiesterase [Clostridia bacterium]